MVNPFDNIPGLGILKDSTKLWEKLTPQERDYYLAAIGLLAFSVGYSFVKHPEILPESIKGVGEIVKGIGEVTPL